MSSVRDIAKQTGVSITTVSRVLNNHPRVSTAVRDRVLAAANRSRYRPKVGKRSTVNIALIYTGALSVGSAFDAALMEGMTNGMEEYGFDLIVLDGKRLRQPGESYSQVFLRKGIRGVVLRSSIAGRQSAIEIADEGFPAVVMGERFDHPSATFVGADSIDASRQAIEHLIDLGHRRIGVVTNVEDDCDHLDRLKGYHTAMEDAGLEHGTNLVYRTPARRVGGEAFMNRFASIANAPTALYFVDPIAGLSALNRAQALGIRVPEDLSIVGFDDQEWRFMSRPKLTAVCQDAMSLGRSAFAVLNQLIDSPDTSADIEIKPAWLEVHGTTGPPNVP